MLFALILLAMIPDVKCCGGWEIGNTVGYLLAAAVEELGRKPFQSTDCFMFWAK